MGNHLGYARLIYKELLDTMADFAAFMHHFNIHCSLISIYIPYIYIYIYIYIYSSLNKFLVHNFTTYDKKKVMNT